MGTLVATRPLGASGLTTTALGLGTAALGVPYGAPGAERAAPPPEAAADTITAALAAGIRYIDTAPAYGEAETIVGKAAGDAECVIATKLATPDGGWEALDGPGVRAHVRASAQRSREALRRDRLDVLQIHNADAALLARRELLEALEDLHAAGAVTLVGATVYGEAAALSAITTPVIDLVQIAHSALDRRAEHSVVPAAAQHRTIVTTRSSLLRGVLSAAGGGLTGPFAPLGEAADAFRQATGATWTELPGAATAWAAGRPGITTTVLGPRDRAELAALLDGAAAFGGAVAGLPAGWQRNVSDDLLDPSRWPALEATA